MLIITLYAEQKKRHRCIEQSFRLCGRRRGWDVLRDQLLIMMSATRTLSCKPKFVDPEPPYSKAMYLLMVAV